MERVFEKLAEPEKGPLGLEVLRILHDLVLRVYRMTEKYMDEAAYAAISAEYVRASQMLNGLIRSLTNPRRRPPIPGPRPPTPEPRPP